MSGKTDLRQLIRERKRTASVISKTEESLRLCRQVMEHSEVKKAKTLLLYASLPDEVDTTTLLQALAEAGKTVLLPVVVNDTDLELRRYTGKNTLHDGAWHIPEPEGLVFADYHKIDVAIVPGIAFDTQGNRLGRGKGYYDRLLAKIPHCYKIGLCFNFQKVDRIPTGPWDIKMDEIL